jgi:hypothetical protein
LGWEIFLEMIVVFVENSVAFWRGRAEKKERTK